MFFEVRSLCAVLLMSLYALMASGCSPSSQAASRSKASIEHGKYLTRVYTCQECHTPLKKSGADLDESLLWAGGVIHPDPTGVQVHSANVTSTVNYQPQLLSDLIRGRVAYKFWMPTILFNGMAADDMHDIVAYLKTLSPINRAMPANLLPADYVVPAANPVIPIPQHQPPIRTVQRGRYLSSMYGCLDCHSARDPKGNYIGATLFQGGGFKLPTPGGGVIIPPNITPEPETGIGAWSDAQIIRALRTGMVPSGRQLNHLMPYSDAYDVMTDQDAADIVRFLRSLRPAKKTWPSKS